MSWNRLRPSTDHGNPCSNLFFQPYGLFFAFLTFYCLGVVAGTKKPMFFFVNSVLLHHQDMVKRREEYAEKLSNVHESQCRIIFKGEMFIKWEI